MAPEGLAQQPVGFGATVFGDERFDVGRRIPTGLLERAALARPPCVGAAHVTGRGPAHQGKSLPGTFPLERGYGAVHTTLSTTGPCASGPPTVQAASAVTVGSPVEEQLAVPRR